MWLLANAIVVFILSGIACTNAFANDYQFRLLSGLYSSQEKFKTSIEGSTDNNVFIYSNRIYFNAFNIGENLYESTIDIRDKQDFFEKLDKQNLKLTPSNKLQVKQLFFRNPGKVSPYFWSVGRFRPGLNLPIYNDGAEAGFPVTALTKVGIFAGMRPYFDDQTSGEMASPTLQTGVYSLYQSQTQNWDQYTNMENLLVYAPKNFQNTPVEAMAFLQTIAMRWKGIHFFNSYLNLQATPAPKLQNLQITYTQNTTPGFTWWVNAFQLDLAEYKHQQEMREILPASIYMQGKAGVKLRFSNQTVLDSEGLYGVRSLDGYNRYEISSSLIFSGLLQGRLMYSTKMGYRKNFTSTDPYILLSSSYFQDRLEWNTNLRYAEERKNQGEILHPTQLGMQFANYFNKNLVGTVGGEWANDEKISILSALVTIGYRFSSQDLTPIRDSAPLGLRER